VLAVGLGEHHQLDVRRVAPEVLEAAYEVIDFVPVQRQAQRAVRRHERPAAAGEHADATERSWRRVSEQLLRFSQAAEHAFGHPVVQQREHTLVLAGRELPLEAIDDAALHPIDRRQPGSTGDVRGFGRPGRQGAEPGEHQT
jgi:hypothetical protein